MRHHRRGAPIVVTTAAPPALSGVSSVGVAGTLSVASTLTNYFSWNAETTSYSGVGGSAKTMAGFFGASSLSTDTAHGGTHALKLTVIGNDSGNQALGADTGSWNTLPFNIPASSVYYRWWMRINTGFSWGAGTAKTKSNRVSGTSSGLVYTGYLRKTGFQMGECDGNACVGDPGVSISYDMDTMADSAWHEYIVRVKINTTGLTDGQFTAWVDGSQVGNVNNYSHVDYGGGANAFNELWGAWMVSPYFQLNGSSSDGGTIYLDDFSADSGWNSLL